MNRNEKAELVNELKNKLTASQATFVTDFKGLKVDELRGLRIKIREAGGEYQVSKNTLMKIAAKDTEAEKISDWLTGNNAIGTTDNDPVALAKALVDFAKSQDKLVIKGGVLNGKIVEMGNIKALADLPSREVLIATMLGTMNAMPTGLVRVMAAIPQGLLYALSAIRDGKEAETA